MRFTAYFAAGRMHTVETPLALAEDDSTAVQIVGRKRDFYRIARHDSDIVLSHFSGQRCKDEMSVLQFDSERCIRERFFYDAFHFNSFFFRHSSSAA